MTHKETDCIKDLRRNLANVFTYNQSKEIYTILVFLNYTSGYLNFAQTFAYLKNVSFFGHCFWQTFCKLDFAKKKCKGIESLPQTHIF